MKIFDFLISIEPGKLAMDREETPTPEAELAPLLSGATPEQSASSSSAENKGILVHDI